MNGGDFIIDFSARAQAIAETLSFSNGETPRQRQVRLMVAAYDALEERKERLALAGTQIIEDALGTRVIVAPAGGRVAAVDARDADVVIVGNRMVKNRWGATNVLTDAQLAAIKGGDLGLLGPWQ